MKLAVIGTGGISVTALDAIRTVPGISVNALYARPHSRQRGEELARAFAIPALFTDYQQLLEQADVDSVYIALVNSAHFDAARAALLAGKHVFLEKPFTVTAAEARALRDLARERDLILLEAITSRHTPVYRRMEEGLRAIGPVHMVLANYAQLSSRWQRYLQGDVAPVFNPALFGGALRDLNIYNLSILVGLFGAPEAAHYQPNLGFNGVDTSGTALLRYPGFTVCCSAAKDSQGRSFFLIQGEQGWMEVQDAPNAMSALRLWAGGLPTDFSPEPVENRMVWEFRDFLEIVRTGDRAAMEAELQRSIAVVETVEMLTAGL